MASIKADISTARHNSETQTGGSITIYFEERGQEDVDWIRAAQDKDKWSSIVNTVMNLGVLKSQGISWLAKEPLASQEGLNSIDFVFRLITEFVIFSKRDAIAAILNLVFSQ